MTEDTQPKGPLTDRHVTIEDVTFDIRTMMAMEGYNFLETIRPALSSLSIESDLMDSDVSLAAMAANLLGALPAATVEQCRLKMFRHVFFTSSAVPTPTQLAGNEETAFKDLNAFHVYEILVRAIAVNFRGFWSVIKSRIPAKDFQIFGQSIPETSPLSSPTL